MKRTYSDEFKMMVVSEYYAGRGGYKALKRRHDVGLTTIKNWCGTYKYNGTSFLNRKNVKRGFYSGDFKINVVENMIESNASLTLTSKIFNVSPKSIRKWAKIYNEWGKETLMNPEIEEGGSS